MRLKKWITNLQSCGEIESNRRFEVIRSGKGGQVNDKKIAIVPYVTNGRNSQVGHDEYESGNIDRVVKYIEEN